MAENIIHELYTQLDDMDLNSENQNRNKNGSQREHHGVAYRISMHNRNIKSTCSLCGGNLYAESYNEDILNEDINANLICPRGCKKLPTSVLEDILNGPPRNLLATGAKYYANKQLQQLPHIEGNSNTAPINAVYSTSSNPHKSPDKPTIKDHDYKFAATTAMLIEQSVRINEILDAIDLILAAHKS